MVNRKIKFFIYLIQFILITTFISYIFIKNDTSTTYTKVDIISNDKIFHIPPSKFTGENFKSSRRPKLFCFILSSSKNCLNGKAKIIYESWAHKCDNYKFVSVIPEEIRLRNESYITENGTEFNNGFDILQPPGLGTKVNDTYHKVYS
jgi:hypothetical protein